MEQNKRTENPEAINLRRLIKSGILKNFIKETKGLWDHIAWRELCVEIEEKGYTPVDFSAVGLHLEEVKVTYYNGKLN